MRRDDAGYVLDMRNAARDVLDFTRGLDWPGFAREKMIQYAVVRAVQIIGEAAWKVSAEYKAAHPEVPRPAIAGMRHRLVHEYVTVDLEKVWRVVQTHVPQLIRLLAPLIPPDEPPDNSSGGAA
jgi:uncharacterized protein with HEPN domain